MHRPRMSGRLQRRTVKQVSTIQLDNAYVIHHLKDAAGHGLHPEQIDALSGHDGLLIDTCLRQVIIRYNPPLHAAGYELFNGQSAYAFLLQTVTGLNSSVPGETNIQGQFRCAWKRWRQSGIPSPQIDSLLQTLLTDAKYIRAHYLHNLGGASYGSLVRKLLKPGQQDRILFVGAGKFSRSMLPFFKQSDTAVWNRRLHAGLELDASTQLFAPAELPTAADWASHLVLTTPPEDAHDQLWLDAIATSNIQHIVHLGRRRGEPGIWQQLDSAIRFDDLDEVFELRKQQSALRNLQVMRARTACNLQARHVAELERDTFALPSQPLPQQA